MKVKIEPTTKVFRPFKLEIEIESEDEAQALSTLFNTSSVNAALDRLFHVDLVFYKTIHRALAELGYGGSWGLPEKLAAEIKNRI